MERELTMSDLLLKDKLYDLRTSNDYTQKYVAEYLNMTRAAYGHYEKGKRTPNHQTLLRLAKLYHIDISELINNSTTPVPDDRLTDFATYDLHKKSHDKALLLHENHPSSSLSKDKVKLLEFYDRMPDMDRRKLLLIAEKMVKDNS
jgi:transcriptional regulator with XRE-family HTH domain